MRIRDWSSDVCSSDLRTWAQLEASECIADVKADAPRVIYTFSDPNCPFCNTFSSAARPWVDSGKVQLRHIMVGVIRPDSATKVANTLTASPPPEALRRHETSYSPSVITPPASVPATVRDILEPNQPPTVQ